MKFWHRGKNASTEAIQHEAGEYADTEAEENADIWDGFDAMDCMMPQGMMIQAQQTMRTRRASKGYPAYAVTKQFSSQPRQPRARKRRQQKRRCEGHRRRIHF